MLQIFAILDRSMCVRLVPLASTSVIICFFMSRFQKYLLWAFSGGGPKRLKLPRRKHDTVRPKSTSQPKWVLYAKYTTWMLRLFTEVASMRGSNIAKLKMLKKLIRLLMRLFLVALY